MSHSGVVIVHVGAGYHSTANVPQYRQICAAALKMAVELLRAGEDAALVVMETVRILESAACTNAGRGSNLSLTGSVECDAGIMVDRGSGGRFAAVAAVPRQPHPVCVAHLLLEMQQRALSLDRQPPVLLVGEQANIWAEQHGLSDSRLTEGATDDSLVTSQALERYQRAKRRLQEVEEQDKTAAKHAKLSTASEQAGGEGGGADDDRYDTVGAVVIDCGGNVAAAASSGGILLKQPGRVGQAAVYGCGCWADAALTTGGVGVGSCTSGGGEHLIMTCLARRVAAEVTRAEHTVQGAQVALKRGFLGSQYIGDKRQRLAGTVVLRHEPHQHAVDIAWAHCSASFVVGYHSTSHTSPQTLCSRLPAEGEPGVTVLSQGTTVRMSPCQLHTRTQHNNKTDDNNSNDSSSTVATSSDNS